MAEDTIKYMCCQSSVGVQKPQVFLFLPEKESAVFLWCTCGWSCLASSHLSIYLPVPKLPTAAPSTCSLATSSWRRVTGSLTTCQTTWFYRSLKNSRCRFRNANIFTRCQQADVWFFWRVLISGSQLWQCPADCTEHCTASSWPGLRPQLYVPICTVCLW